MCLVFFPNNFRKWPSFQTFMLMLTEMSARGGFRSFRFTSYVNKRQPTVICVIYILTQHGQFVCFHLHVIAICRTGFSEKRGTKTQ